MHQDWWDNLNSSWKELLIRNWLLFIKYKGSLEEYLWDAYGAYDYFLCRSMGLPFNDINEDLTISEMIIKNHLRAVDDNVIEQILNMEFVAMEGSVSSLLPLSYFHNVQILDFHCNNSSQITDFSPLKKFGRVSVLDYSDYTIIDFDKVSNIKDFPNINYIKCIGMPEDDINCILKDLKGYKI